MPTGVHESFYDPLAGFFPVLTAIVSLVGRGWTFRFFLITVAVQPVLFFPHVPPVHDNRNGQEGPVSNILEQSRLVKIYGNF
jgi:hypothetical protein